MDTSSFPLVSAIITTHNRCNLLAKAIASVQNQTYKNIEIIVVDDASEDETPKLCSRINNIHYIRIDKEHSNGGNHARNIGILNAGGEFVALLDDDDEWLPQKIELQMRKYTSEDIGLVYCELYVDVGINIFNYNVAYKREGNILQNREYWKPLCTTSAMLIRKSVFDNVGAFDENVRYWQEYEFFLRVIQKYNISLVKEPLVKYRKDLRDKYRLTNNYDAWEKSVSYILNKHEQLFLQLGQRERNKFWITYYSEAAFRAGAIKNKKLMKKLYLKCYKIAPNPEYLLRGLLGISRQQTTYVESIVKKVMYIKEKARG